MLIHESFDDYLMNYLRALKEETTVYVVMKEDSVSWQDRFPNTKRYLNVYERHDGLFVIGKMFFSSYRTLQNVYFRRFGHGTYNPTHDCVYFIETGDAFLYCPKRECRVVHEKLGLDCPSSCGMKILTVAMSERKGCPFHKLPSSMVRELSTFL